MKVKEIELRRSIRKFRPEPVPEKLLRQALEAARPDTTMIIIAQRIASVRRADRILVLDGGTIADIGTHAELLRRCAIYQDIYNSQIGEETEEHEQ